MNILEGTVIKEQGITFAVAVVNRNVIHNQLEVQRHIRKYQQEVFGNIPVVLMAQDARGVPTYVGRPDIARFMSRVPLRAIPWKKYRLN